MCPAIVCITTSEKAYTCDVRQTCVPLLQTWQELLSRPVVDVESEFSQSRKARLDIIDRVTVAKTKGASNI